MSTNSTAKEIADPESSEVDYAANKGDATRFGHERCFHSISSYHISYHTLHL
jgi:hypothetical protein